MEESFKNLHLEMIR